MSGRSNNEGRNSRSCFACRSRSAARKSRSRTLPASMKASAHRPPADYDWGYGKQPVINVSWNDAKAYVGWLSRKTGGKYRLLSKPNGNTPRAAARRYVNPCPSGSASKFPRIGSLRHALRLSRSPKATARKRPFNRRIEANPFRTAACHGNVSEWVEDCWAETLAGLPRDGSSAPR